MSHQPASALFCIVTSAYGDIIQTGEAYLIPYFLAVFAFAVRLMVLELAVGRHLRGDGPWGESKGAN